MVVVIIVVVVIAELATVVDMFMWQRPYPTEFISISQLPEQQLPRLAPLE